MRPLPTKIALLCAAISANFLPATAMSQSLGDMMRTLRQVASADPVGTFKSVAETIQGQVAPGTETQDAEGKVILYRTAWCGYCKRAAAYMQRKNIPVVERDIESNPSARAEYAKLGGKGAVPFIVFGEKTMYGFSEGPFEKNYADFQTALATAPKARAGENSGATNENSTALQAGQTMLGKIAGVSVYAQANKSGQKLMVLSKTTEVIYMGEERDGLYRVTTQRGEGWVDKLLVKKS